MRRGGADLADVGNRSEFCREDTVDQHARRVVGRVVRRIEHVLTVHCLHGDLGGEGEPGTEGEPAGRGRQRAPESSHRLALSGQQGRQAQGEQRHPADLRLGRAGCHDVGDTKGEERERGADNQRGGGGDRTISRLHLGLAM